MDLISIPGNAIPSGSNVTALKTRDGIVLRAAFWSAMRQTPVGTVCLMPGRSEFIEKYFEVVEDLRRRGLSVTAFDWRGQGGSQRLLSDPRKGHVRRFDDYAQDLRTVIDDMETRQCPKPYFALAHSMGGAALLIALARGETRFARGFLCAPLVAIHPSKAPRGASALAEALCLAGMGTAYVPGGGATSVMTKPFEGNFLSSDLQRYQRTGDIITAAPQYAIGDPTIGWVRAAYRAFAEFERIDFGFRIETPLLFVLAGGDTLVSTSAAAALGDRVKGAASITIPYARHEILMEQDQYREQLMAAFDAFIPGERPQAEVAKLSR